MIHINLESGDILPQTGFSSQGGRFMKAPRISHVVLLVLLLIACLMRSAMAQCGASAGNQYEHYMSPQYMDSLIGDLAKLIPYYNHPFGCQTLSLSWGISCVIEVEKRQCVQYE